LESVPIFRGLSEREQREIGQITTERQFQKGQLIFTPGDENHNLYVIHKGKVKLSRLSESGKEQILRIAGPGDFFGELALFSRLPASTQAQAMDDLVMCVIDGERLKGLLEKYPHIALKVMEELSARLETAENMIESLALHSVDQRIAQALLQYGADQFELPISKGDLAASLGMTQETLSRKLSAWQVQGLIRQTGQRGIEILDRESLKELADLG
jgi:CRP/FNR family transcriptional regulator